MSAVPDGTKIASEFEAGASIRLLSQKYGLPEKAVLPFLPKDAQARYEDVNKRFENNHNIKEVGERTRLSKQEASRYLSSGSLKDAIYMIRGFNGDIDIIVERCGCSPQEATDYQDLVIKEKGDPLHWLLEAIQLPAAQIRTCLKGIPDQAILERLRHIPGGVCSPSSENRINKLFDDLQVGPEKRQDYLHQL